MRCQGLHSSTRSYDPAMAQALTGLLRSAPRLSISATNSGGADRSGRYGTKCAVQQDVQCPLLAAKELGVRTEIVTSKSMYTIVDCAISQGQDLVFAEFPGSPGI